MCNHKRKIMFAGWSKNPRSAYLRTERAGWSVVIQLQWSFNYNSSAPYTVHEHTMPTPKHCNTTAWLVMTVFFHSLCTRLLTTEKRRRRNESVFYPAAALPNSTFPTDPPLSIPDSPRPAFLLGFLPPLPSFFHSFSLSLPVPRRAFSESGREEASTRWQNQLSRDPPHFCFIYFYILVYCVTVFLCLFFVPMAMERSIFFGLWCLCFRICIFISFMLEWGCLIYVAAGNQFYTFPSSLFLHLSHPVLFSSSLFALTVCVG